MEDKKRLLIGEPVKIMYPYDATLWNVEGFVINVENGDKYLIQDFQGNKVCIDYIFLKIKN